MEKEKHLKHLMEMKSGSVKAFSEDIGLAYTTIRSILERGIFNAKVENVIKICKGLNIKPENLMEINDTLISESITILIKLTPPRQENVLTYANKQLDEQNKVTNIEDYEDIDVNLLAAAGLGTMNFDKENPIEQVRMHPSEIPNDYDLVARVTGDSMHPFFRDGEIIFIKEQHYLTENMIGLVEINGEVFLKKMYKENDRLILESLNKDKDEQGKALYPKFYADELDDVRIVGKTI